jgi:signal transduction histidine kinase
MRQHTAHARTDREALFAAVVEHSFAQMPAAIASAATMAIVFMVSCLASSSGWRLALWALAQGITLTTNLAVYAQFRGAPLRQRPSAARYARRLGALLTGVAWGLGGVLWPLQPELGPSFALAFCYAGLGAGAVYTLAGDPVAFVLVTLPAILPDAWFAFPSLWWASMLMVAFLGSTFFVNLRSTQALRASLFLRFENAELLERAMEARDAAERARREAERAADARRRFLASASHELRQPVQALSLFVDALARTTAGDGEHERAVEALVRTTEALRSTLEGLLDISRLDAGLCTGAPAPLALEPLLAEVVAALSLESESRGMVIHARGRPTVVLADRALLARVIHNLASNAIRHAGHGRVLVAVRQRGDRCAIQVWDQGRGIADGDRERIFEEFVQIAGPRSDGGRGLGLGLPIVRRICDACGWSLSLQSAVGRGTVFSVSLPLAGELRQMA